MDRKLKKIDIAFPILMTSLDSDLVVDSSAIKEHSGGKRLKSSLAVEANDGVVRILD